MADKIDSNVTGGRYAEEASIKVLGGSPVWYPLEPNSYSDFGGELALVARNPINPSRQRKKGVITDLDASGGLSQDLTQTNMTRLLQGFCFADIRAKLDTAPMNAAATLLTGVTASTKTYAAAAGLAAFLASDLVFASGFGQAGNNGLKTVASSTTGTVVVVETAVDEASPPTLARLRKVGYVFASGVATIDVSGSYPRLLRSSGAKDFTTFGLIPGEWVFVGGDLTANKFATAANNGFARVRSVGVTFIEFDKTSATMVADAGTGKTIHLFYGNLIKNEDDPALIKRRTYQFERTLGNDTAGVMSEYLTGTILNELAVQIKMADKITVDLGMIACDNEQRNGTLGVKAGDRPSIEEAPCFNTSSDFSRIKLHVIEAGETNPDPLFAYMTELTLTINNNASPNKAVSVLGAFDVTVGTFTVAGSITAYFANIEAVQAVRNNSDVGLDFAVVKDNAGLVFDVPLIALGDGRLNVEQDQPITLPLSLEAAEGEYGHTLLINEFPYLPDAAE